MTTLRIAVTAFLLAVASATSGADSAYNKGVDAYQGKNYEEAFRHWSEAAANGSVDALNNLAFLLYNGYGVTKNQEEAVDLWRRAAYAGHSEAKWHLGEAYEYGKGIKKDRPRAHAWYRCAVATAKWKIEAKDDEETEKHILKDAEDAVNGLGPLLSQQELSRSDELTAECIQRYGRPAL